MGQATLDLPDPLESAGVNPDGSQAQSADDLLSQLAGSEIDRLLAESGDLAPGNAGGDAAAEIAESPALSSPGFSTPDFPASAEHIKTPLEQEMDLDAAIDAAALDHAAVHKTEAETPVDSSPQIELGPAIRRLPFFLKPLEWLNAPLDPWPDELRELLGKIGLLTGVNALAVIAYVLIFRKHPHH